MSSSVPPDVEGHGTWHTGQGCPEEERPSLRGWRALWAGNWEIETSFLHPESGSMVLKDISNRKGALLNVSERAAQCIFLCLRHRAGSYAIPIPCLRSGPRRLIGRRLENRDGTLCHVSGGEVYEQPVIKKEAFESDEAIWDRMRATCLNESGRWKRWLPFFGPVAVREVEFQFMGIKDRSGRFPIFGLTPVNEEKVREEADDIIASVPTVVDTEYGNGCVGFSHSTKCPASSGLDSPCILDMADEARLRKRRLDMLFILKDCARNPRKANGLSTLEGMAQESCIYELERDDQIILPQCDQPYTRTDKLRGIEIAVGWQFDCIVSELPVSVTLTWFCLALIWAAVVVWEGATDDWGTAMAFGQLLAVSISLIVVRARD